MNITPAMLAESLAATQSIDRVVEIGQSVGFKVGELHVFKASGRGRSMIGGIDFANGFLYQIQGLNDEEQGPAA